MDESGSTALGMSVVGRCTPLLAAPGRLQQPEIGDGWPILLAEGTLLLHAGRVLRVDVAADRRVKADEPAGPVIASA